MHLTLYTENAFRVLMYLANNGHKLATVGEISTFYSVSHNHIAKVAHHLGSKGFIQTQRGLHGGIKLTRDPHSINVRDIVDEMESEKDIFKCFRKPSPDCPYAKNCKLKCVLEKARQGFMDILKQFTLADLLEEDNPLAKSLHHT